MPKKRDPKNNYYYRRKNHPTRGGKYHLKFGRYGWQEELNRLDNAMQNHIEIGNTYTFPYRKIDFSNRGGERSLRRYAKGEVVGTEVIHNKWFVHIRGTYRYGSLSDLKRVGVYSNVAKLEFDLDLDD